MVGGGGDSVRKQDPALTIYYLKCLQLAHIVSRIEIPNNYDTKVENFDNYFSFFHSLFRVLFIHLTLFLSLFNYISFYFLYS